MSAKDTFVFRGTATSPQSFRKLKLPSSMTSMRMSDNFSPSPVNKLAPSNMDSFQESAELSQTNKRRYSEYPMRNVGLGGGSSSSSYTGTSVPSSQFQQKQSPNSIRKDLNNYVPMQTIKMEGDVTRIFTVGNEITDETVLVTTGPNSMFIYRMKSSEKHTEGEGDPAHIKSTTKFELIKIQGIILQSFTQRAFAISSTCSITLPPKRLIYAIAPFSKAVVYLYDCKEEDSIPESILLDNDNEESMSVVNHLVHNFPVIGLAIKEDKYLACMQENSSVVVWDIPSSIKIVTFPLKSNGIHIAWHPSEPFQLMVVESNGWIKFYNVYKQSCFMTFYVGRSPLYCADWSVTNSLLAVVGWPGGFTIINTSQPNSNMFKVYEQPQKVIRRVKFNPVDEKCIVTLERGSGSPGILRLWRQNFASHVWSHSNDQIKDIAWVQGKPFVVVLSHGKVSFYEASAL